MKYYLKLFMLLPIGLIAAIIIYPFLHEASHSLCAIAFDAEVVKFNLSPLPSVLCNVEGLTKIQLFLVAIAGPIVPFVMCSLIKTKFFWLEYVRMIIVLISILSFSISLIGILFGWEIISEQDDIIRFASYIENGKTISVGICVIGICIAIIGLVRITKSHNCLKYFEISL